METLLAHVARRKGKISAMIAALEESSSSSSRERDRVASSIII
jgi:hypothetical protein